MSDQTQYRLKFEEYLKEFGHFKGKISQKVHNGNLNEKLEKTIQEQLVCSIHMKNGVKLIISFNKGLKHDEHLAIFLFKKNYDQKDK